MKRLLFLVLLFSVPACSAYQTESYEPGNRCHNITSCAGTELWGYLMAGEESFLTGKEPFTDVCYFSAELNYKGELRGPSRMPSRMQIPKGARTHLVVANISNASLMHFLLQPEFDQRNRLVDSIVRLSSGYDGIQIDFESVQADDADAFRAFLGEIKRKAPEKILSAAIPARKKTLSRDAYEYKALSSIADRIIIMAYDEHWSASNPGPVASLRWCEKVADYAAKEIPLEKLVMGIPLYGRSWQDKKLAKAVRFKNIVDLEKQHSKPLRGRVSAQTDPAFEYEEKVKVVVYYEDSASILRKMDTYREKGIHSLAFWRIGQEPGDLWDEIRKKGTR